MSGKKLSLYFHVPFCQKKCPYCHFYSEKFDSVKSSLYLDALEMEWQRKEDLVADKEIVSIYFGGGTPTLIGPQALEKILKKIPFADNCEITIEANPESTSLTLLQDLYSLGIHRLSIGVQSFHDITLEFLKRRHSGKRALQTIEDAVLAGFSNISIDLMYDLPYQKLEDWLFSLSWIPKIPITHISLYNLTIEPNTYFDKKRKVLSPFFPEEKISLSMLQDAIDLFEKADFHRYEISAFAKNDLISIHNTGYWTGREYLGIGPSAHSYFHGKRSKNISDLQKYSEKLLKNIDPQDFEEILLPIAQKRELLALELRMIEGVDLRVWEKKSGPLDPEGHQILSTLCSEGLLEKNQQRYRLSKKGLLFYDTVAAELVY